MDITGKVPYYMKIEYRHKENEPCIRMRRESITIMEDDIRYDSWSITELK